MRARHGQDYRQSLQERGRRLVERLGGRWLGSGGMCRCPAHDDHTPSLSIRAGEKRLLFHCFAGCEATAIILALHGLGLLTPEASAPVGGGEDSPADPGRSNRRAAANLWSAAGAIEGSPAESYLRSRGLIVPARDLRYHSRTPLGPGALVVFRPALLAAVRDESGLVAVHRTFLDLEPSRLAGIPAPRRALGRLGEGAVRLRAPRDGVLGLAEGLETALAATLLTGISCWAALGNERLSRVAVPSAVRRLVLFLDNDVPGRRAGEFAREALEPTGIAIETRWPCASGTDWNDVLLTRGGAGADKEGRERSVADRRGRLALPR